MTPMPDKSFADLGRGVVYVATSPATLAEAFESLRRLRSSNPGLPACLITDQPEEATRDWPKIVRLQDPLHSSGDKIHMRRSPWGLTLFLDSDTSVYSDLGPVFALLEKFDFAAVQSSSGYHYDLPDTPSTFPEFNSGVVAFRNSPAVQSFFDQWQRYYEEDHSQYAERVWDQKSLRHALFLSGLRIASLPPEYNFMPTTPGFAMTPIHIAHGRDFSQIDRMKRRLDRKTGPRVWVPGIGVLRSAYHTHPGEIGWAALRGSLHWLRWFIRRQL
jgi:hypothetical protein